MLMQRYVLLLPRIYLYLDAPKIKRFAIFTFSAGGIYLYLAAPKIKRFAIFTICAGGEKRTRVHFAGSCTAPFARSGYCFTGIKP